MSQSICVTCCLTTVWTRQVSSAFCKTSRPQSPFYMTFALSQPVSTGIMKFSLEQQVAELCLVVLQLHLPHKMSKSHCFCKRPSFLKESLTNVFIHLDRNYSTEPGNSFYRSFKPTSKAHNHSQSKHIPMWLPADETSDSVGMDELIAEKNCRIGALRSESWVEDEADRMFGVLCSSTASTTCYTAC